MISRTQEDIMKNWNMSEIDTPLVSVKCMTYNQEKYIGQCIDGFLMQKTSFPFEILIHDDCSTDDTTNIVLEYAKKYPKIIKPILEDENQYSKHDGSHHKKIDAAIKGKYVALCEGDDYWIDENKLQMQVDFLENNPEYTMCFHGADFDIIGDFDVPENLKNIEDRDYSATEIFENWTIPTASVVYNKNILNFPVKNEAKAMFGDIVLFEKCSHMGKIYGFSKKMSVYRIHNGGVSHSKKSINKRRLGFPRHYEFIYENFPLIDRRVILKKIIRAYIACLIYCGNLADKFRYVKNIIKYSCIFVSSLL